MNEHVYHQGHIMDVNLAYNVLEEHGTSFSQASRFLPTAVADDAAILYRFCRTVDDEVDEARDVHTATENLLGLRRQVAGVDAPLSTVADVLNISGRLKIRKVQLLSLLSGVGSDIGPVRIETKLELGRYAYRVAGVVGQMMARVLRVVHYEAEQYAVDLGLAMQLTNICRDVAEDARRDRVYLPRETLKKHGIVIRSTQTISNDDTDLRDVVRDVLADAEILYRRARFGLRYIPLRSRLGISVALRLYRGIGIKLLRVHDANLFMVELPW